MLVSLEAVKQYFAEQGLAGRIVVHDQASDTVEHAAAVIGCQPGQIAKTMAFQQKEGVVLVVMAGDYKINNQAYKAQFHQKASMVPFAEVATIVGHEPGGVCPFAINPGILVYLDESLNQYRTVYPAAGSPDSTIELTVAELVKYSQGTWVAVTKPR